MHVALPSCTCYKAPEKFDFPVGQVEIELAGVQRPCAVAPDRIGKRHDDLRGDDLLAMGDQPERAAEWLARNGLYKIAVDSGPKGVEIGRASCRERVCQDVYIRVVAVTLKKKNKSE